MVDAAQYKYENATVKVVAKPAGVMSIGQPSKITVTVNRANGSPLSEAEIWLNSSQGGLFTVSSGRTDSRGQFASYFTSSSPGEYEVKANVKDKDREYQGETLVEFAPPTGYGVVGSLLMGIIVILVAAGYIMFLRRR